MARGVDDPEVWESLFLTLTDLQEVLAIVQEQGQSEWIYPMICFAAHTGARRAELLRARVEDFDLEGSTVLIREKKKERGKLTTRRVPISPFLNRVMTVWLGEQHSEGLWAFTHPAIVPRSRKVRDRFEPITVNDSNGHLHRSLSRSRWGMVG